MHKFLHSICKQSQSSKLNSCTLPCYPSDINQLHSSSSILWDSRLLQCVISLLHNRNHVLSLSISIGTFSRLENPEAFIHHNIHFLSIPSQTQTIVHTCISLQFFISTALYYLILVKQMITIISVFKRHSTYKDSTIFQTDLWSTMIPDTFWLKARFRVSIQKPFDF